MTQEVTRLRDKLLASEALVRKLRSWQDSDTYIGAGEEGWKELVEGQ